MFMFILTLLITTLEGTISQKESEPSVNGVTYKLYNSHHINGTIITSDNVISSVVFIHDKPCVFITHGYTASIEDDSVMDIVTAYLESGMNLNTIAVDWKDKASGLYESVVLGVADVGADISRFIGKLIDLGLCSAESTHLIGHSLGAHVMGNAGKTFQTEKDMKFSRITGLDTAGVGYEYNLANFQASLKPGDAVCTDAIHTDAGRFGLTRPTAQVDYYVNGGGPRQPGCWTMDPYCAHGRSFQLYAVTVKYPYGFLATQCGSYEDYNADRCEGNPNQFMGFLTNCKIPGKYYLKTGRAYPYFLQNQV